MPQLKSFTPPKPKQLPKDDYLLSTPDGRNLMGSIVDDNPMITLAEATKEANEWMKQAPVPPRRPDIEGEDARREAAIERMRQALEYRKNEMQRRALEKKIEEAQKEADIREYTERTWKDPRTGEIVGPGGRGI